MKEDKYVSAALVVAIVLAAAIFGGAIAYHEVDSRHRAWYRRYNQLYGETKFTGTITDAKCKHDSFPGASGDEDASGCDWIVGNSTVRWVVSDKGKYEGLTLAYPPDDSDANAAPASSGTSVTVSSPLDSHDVDDIKQTSLPKNPDVGKKVEVFGRRVGGDSEISLDKPQYYIKVIGD